MARKVLQMQELKDLELYSFQAVAKGTGLDVRLDKVCIMTSKEDHRHRDFRKQYCSKFSLYDESLRYIGRRNSDMQSEIRSAGKQIQNSKNFCKVNRISANRCYLVNLHKGFMRD